MKYKCMIKKINIYKILLLISISFFLFLSCQARYYNRQKNASEYIEETSKPDYWEYIVKNIEYNDIKIVTMILIDELIINDDLSDKYYINILREQTKNDTVIYFIFKHMGHDLIFVDKKSPSLYIVADSSNYKFTANRTNRDDGTFIYQCFQKEGFSIEEEKIYYQIGLEKLANIIYSDKIYVKLISNSRTFVTEIPASTKKYLRKFYKNILVDNQK